MSSTTAPDGTGSPGAASPEDPSDAGPCYVLVFEGDSTRLVHLPRRGTVVVGNAATAGIRLSSDSVRPAHATITTDGSDAVLSTCEGAVSVAVNEEPLLGEHALTSGDVITLGDTTLAFHRNTIRVSVRPALTQGQFQSRLEEEIERSLRYQNPLALLIIDGSSRPEHVVRCLEAVCRIVRRVDVVGRTGRTEIGILFPETGHSAGIPAGRILESLAAIGAGPRGGLAVCPEDGCSPDTLLTGARSAARAAAPGQVGVVLSACSAFRVGDRTVVAADPVMKSLFALLKRIAPSTLPVLVQGETGAGKEIVAQALHAWSPRSARRIVAINCAALPETLLESELFGHERGAFSGAVASKPGLFERASGGTVFLDEIGECSPATQAKLLRVLETHRVSRVGGQDERPVDVRIVSATNRSLEVEIREGRFRQDLYYRLNAATALVPPLRDRALDIPILARHFLVEACEALGRSPMTIAPGAMQRLVMHSWPGNVRELKNVMDFAAASISDDELRGNQLPDQIAASIAPWMLPRAAPDARSAPNAPLASTRDAVGPPTTFRSIYDEIAELERRRILEALEASGGARAKAADLIKMPLRTFVTKLKVYGLSGGRSQDERAKP